MEALCWPSAPFYSQHVEDYLAHSRYSVNMWCLNGEVNSFSTVITKRSLLVFYLWSQPEGKDLILVIGQNIIVVASFFIVVDLDV